MVQGIWQISDLIDEREIEELAEKYGHPECRCYSLEVSKKNFENWGRALVNKRRGEVVFVAQQPAGLILHSKDFYPPGIYRLPSGGVRWGESVLSALHREAWEEMGLKLEVERFLGLLEYKLCCQWETVPFVSYVFLVRGSKGKPVPNDKEEHILSFRQVSVAELPAVAASLRSLEGDWRDWGEFRAIVHDFVVEMMRGI
jgi:8-oxo-dGTP pyrophosphatase MutT (NUDIX family)